MTDNRPPIIMYSRHTFCPDVARSRLRLEELGYEWMEHDVESDLQRKREVLEMTGRVKVPTLVIGERIIVEPSVEQLDDALIAAGYDVDDEA